MGRAVVIGVMGPGRDASQLNLQAARQLGHFIATHGWVLLTGGRAAGVMAASSQAAKAAGGLTLGLLPGTDRRDADDSVMLPIPTGLGNARNALNVLASDMVVACAFGLGAGTLSEIALAMKENKPLLLLSDDPHTTTFMNSFSYQHLTIAATIQQALSRLEAMVKGMLTREGCHSLNMSRFSNEA